MSDPRTARIGWATHDRYRTATETQIRDFILLSGWAFEFQAGERGLEEKAAEALDRFVALGLPYRQSQKGRRFDPVETLNFIKWMGLAGKDFFWVDRFVETGRRLVRSQSSAGYRYSIAFRRTVNIEPLNGQRAVRLRLPIPLAGPSLSDLTIADVSAGPLTTRMDRSSRTPPGRPRDDAGGAIFLLRVVGSRRLGPRRPRTLSRPERRLDPGHAAHKRLGRRLRRRRCDTGRNRPAILGFHPRQPVPRRRALRSGRQCAFRGRMGAQFGMVRLSGRQRASCVSLSGAGRAGPAALRLPPLSRGADLSFLGRGLARARGLDSIRPHGLGSLGRRTRRRVAQPFRRAGRCAHDHNMHAPAIHWIARRPLSAALAGRFVRNSRRR
jgi:hypothetical protein